MNFSAPLLSLIHAPSSHIRPVEHDSTFQIIRYARDDATAPGGAMGSDGEVPGDMFQSEIWLY